MLLKAALYYSRIALHVLKALAMLAFLLPFWSPTRKWDEVRAWSRQALTIFGLSINVHGHERGDGGPVLLVSNHTSWLDILLIQTQFDAVFVAKSEVRGWPAFGWMAARLGTVFVSRRSSQDLFEHTKALTGRLASGATVCIFPEGTTTDGATVLPFKTAMFQAAVNSGVAVQPIFIRYLRADGAQASEATFTGDMTLLQSFASLARLRDGRAELGLLPTIQGGSLARRELASAAERSIRGACMDREERHEYAIRDRAA